PSNPKSTRPFEGFSQPHYVAYVLRRQGAPQWVELGEAKAIDEAVASLRQALGDPKRADVRSLARRVDKRVMQPVRALLGDTRRALISPDGSLNLLPFAALVDERNNYLVTRYEFSYLTSGRDLLRLQVPRESKGGPLIVAAPAFGEMASADESEGRNLGLPKGDQNTGAQTEFSSLYFRPLPGTVGEARALERLLPQSKALTGEQSTEKPLNQAS